MAKKMKPGQKRCPSCGATVKGPRTKTCPKCGHEFIGMKQARPIPEAAPAVAEKLTKNGGELRVNKTQAVRDYLKAHSGATNGEVATALTEQGIDITARHVSAIKGKLKKASNGKKAAKPAPEVAPAPVAVAKPATNGGTITLEQVKKIAHTIQTLGGIQRVTEVLEVIKEMGGVKKFKDLAEAMTVIDTNDIPF